jgi:hypothetical protein
MPDESAGSPGSNPGETSTQRGHTATSRRENFQRKTSRHRTNGGAPGVKNVFPLKWSEDGKGTPADQISSHARRQCFPAARATPAKRGRRPRPSQGATGRGVTRRSLSSLFFLFPLYLVRFLASLGTPCSFLTKEKEKEKEKEERGKKKDGMTLFRPPRPFYFPKKLCGFAAPHSRIWPSL